MPSHPGKLAESGRSMNSTAPVSPHNFGFPDVGMHGAPVEQGLVSEPVMDRQDGRDQREEPAEHAEGEAEMMELFALLMMLMQGGEQDMTGGGLPPQGMPQQGGMMY